MTEHYDLLILIPNRTMCLSTRLIVVEIESSNPQVWQSYNVASIAYQPRENDIFRFLMVGDHGFKLLGSP